MAIAGSPSAATQARAATTLVICSEEVVASAPAHQGPEPAVIAIGSAIGRPPSSRLTVSSQWQSVAACGARPVSANTSNACSAAAGWLSGDRRSPSRPQP